VETLTAHRATGLDPILPATPESSVSAVTWPAIFGGAIVAAATSIVLVALGSGLGLASVSPWRDSGASATGVAWMAAAWLIVVQWLSAGAGGYLAGRLRTKWANTHTHEVFFRDTAHGFITWALGTVIVAAFLASAVGSAISGGVHAAATVGAGAAAGAGGAAAAQRWPPMTWTCCSVHPKQHRPPLQRTREQKPRAFSPTALQQAMCPRPIAPTWRSWSPRERESRPRKHRSE
jgi:hypothetical protein